MYNFSSRAERGSSKPRFQTGVTSGAARRFQRGAWPTENIRLNDKRIECQISAMTKTCEPTLPTKSLVIYSVKVYIERAGFFSGLTLQPLGHR
jgi:hypothetical protein